MMTYIPKIQCWCKKRIWSRPVCEKNVLIKTKMKPHGEEVTDFYDKKVDSNYTCLHSL